LPLLPVARARSVVGVAAERETDKDMEIEKGVENKARSRKKEKKNVLAHQLCVRQPFNVPLITSLLTVSS
jgi:hypothetical protein